MKGSVLKVALSAAVALPLYFGAQTASANAIATSYLQIADLEIQINTGDGFRKAVLGQDIRYQAVVSEGVSSTLLNGGQLSALLNVGGGQDGSGTSGGTADVQLNPFGFDLAAQCFGDCDGGFLAGYYGENSFNYFGDGVAPEPMIAGTGINYAVSDMLIAGSALDVAVPPGGITLPGMVLPPGVSIETPAGVDAPVEDSNGDTFIPEGNIIRLPSADAQTMSDSGITSNGDASASIAEASVSGSIVALVSGEIRINFDFNRFVRVGLGAGALPGSKAQVTDNQFSIKVGNAESCGGVFNACVASYDLTTAEGSFVAVTQTPGAVLSAPQSGSGTVSFGIAENDLVYVDILSQTGTSVSLTQQQQTGPAPATLALFGLGLLGLARRRFK
jgi:hypothetical protein